MEWWQFCGSLKPMFWLFTRACLLFKTLKNRFFFAIYFGNLWHWNTRGYQELQVVTRGDKGLQGVTRGYKGLQRVTGAYKGLQGVTRGYRGLQGNAGSYKGLWKLFLTRTFPDTFSWCVLHKNESWRNLKFLTKTID